MLSYVLLVLVVGVALLLFVVEGLLLTAELLVLFNSFSVVRTALLERVVEDLGVALLLLFLTAVALLFALPFVFLIIELLLLLLLFAILLLPILPPLTMFLPFLFSDLLYVFPE